MNVHRNTSDGSDSSNEPSESFSRLRLNNTPRPPSNDYLNDNRSPSNDRLNDTHRPHPNYRSNNTPSPFTHRSNNTRTNSMIMTILFDQIPLFIQLLTPMITVCFVRITIHLFDQNLHLFI